MRNPIEAVRLALDQEKFEGQMRHEIASRVGSREQFWHKISKVSETNLRLPTPHPHLYNQRLTALLAYRFCFLLPLYNPAKANKILSLMITKVQDDLQEGEE